MNSNAYPTVTIDLVLDRAHLNEVLTAVLHSILFHRCFGNVKPKTFEVLGATLPGVQDAGMDALVRQKVDTFGKAEASRKGQILFTFSERKQKKSWFSTGEEDVPWEQWIVNVETRQPPGNALQKFHTDLSDTLTKSVNTMLTHTSSERGRVAVPLITNAQGISPFPVNISVVQNGVELG